jgi:hypothetical protein
VLVLVVRQPEQLGALGVADSHRNGVLPPAPTSIRFSPSFSFAPRNVTSFRAARSSLCFTCSPGLTAQRVFAFALETKHLPSGGDNRYRRLAMLLLG